jgi:hypothetical protein
LVNLSASPYHLGKLEVREDILGRTAAFLGIRCSTATLSAARMNWCSTAAAWCSTPEGARSAKAALFEEDLLHISLSNHWNVTSNRPAMSNHWTTRKFTGVALACGIT